MSPMVRPGCSMIGDAEQVTIGDGDELHRDGGNDFGGGAIVGRVMTGKPVAVVTRLSEGPGLYRPRRVFRRGLDETQARARFGVIVDGDSKLLAVVVGAIKGDNKFFIIGAIR